MRITWLAACLSAAAILAGCGSEPPAQQPSPSVAPTEHGSLAHCLGEHGVPAAPGPAVGPPPGVPAETWQQAMQECSSLAPGPADRP
ncbi:hypothetical protein [Mycolicibacterium sp. XJ1819]